MAESTLKKAQIHVGCQICKQQRTVSWKCIDCNRLLCDTCKMSHENIPATENHEVLSTKSILPQRSIRSNPKNCKFHGKSLTLHCSTCDILICIDCILEKHNTHTFGDMDSIKQREREKFEKFLNEIQIERKTSQEKIEKYELIKQECEEDFSSKRSLVNKRVEELVDWIKEWGRCLTDQLDNGQLSHLKDLEAIIAENKEFIISIDKVEINIQNLLKKDDLTLAFQNFKTFKEQLQNPKLPEPSKLQILYADGNLEKKTLSDILGRIVLTTQRNKAEAHERPKSRKRAVVQYSYEAENEDELTIEEGDIVEDIEDIQEGWSKGRCDGIIGMFPLNFVKIIEDK